MDLNPSILLVEDDRDLSEALSQLIADEGFTVSVASNGKEALDYLQTHPAPQLILLDVMMPVMDGIEFRARQSANPKLATIPVVVLSAGDLSHAKARNLDAVEWLKKPIDLNRLFELIRQFCTVGAS